MAALMFCDFSPTGLCLFDGGEEHDKDLPSLSADELKNVMKKYSQGNLSRPKDPTAHLKDSQMVRAYIRMYRRLLDMLVLITGDNRESDPHHRQVWIHPHRCKSTPTGVDTPPQVWIHPRRCGSTPTGADPPPQVKALRRKVALEIHRSRIFL